MSTVLADVNADAGHLVASKLQQVLSETYALYLVTHNYHWNVEGPKFVSLHTLFEQQYTELALAIDEIAERIRALGVYAETYENSDLLRDANDLPAPQRDSGDAASTQMVKNLITLSESLIAACNAAKHAASAADDDESEDMMIGRITVHQKAIWMLRSVIK